MMSKRLSEILVKLILFILGLISIITTLFIFIYIFMKGKDIINLSFIFEVPSGMPVGTSGGIYPALLGSIYLGALSALIGGVIGILTSIYIVFYSSNTFLNRITRFSVSFLSGIPSIIFGLVGYTLLIYKFGMPRSLICASITISVMILPFVSIRAQKIFMENESRYMKESICLGINREYTILKLILPSCLIELITTLALAMAYGMGAVAPIMYTGAVMVSSLPVELNKPFMSLPYHLYMLVVDGASFEYAYGTAFVLISLLLIIHLLCRSIGFFRDGAQWKIKK